MGSYYARIARRASYDSPPQFPGGTVARGTPTTYVPGALAGHNPEGNVEKNEKPCSQPNLIGCFPQNSLVQIGDKGT